MRIRVGSRAFCPTLFATLLTLFVVPVFYTLLDDLAVRITGKKRVKAAEPTHAYGD